MLKLSSRKPDVAADIKGTRIRKGAGMTACMIGWVHGKFARDLTVI
jgi:hypothetical protein